MSRAWPGRVPGVLGWCVWSIWRFASFERRKSLATLTSRRRLDNRQFTSLVNAEEQELDFFVCFSIFDYCTSGRMKI